MLMKRFALILGAFAILMLPVSSAFAETFNFSFTGPFFFGSGTFTATPEGVDHYSITAVAGTVDGSSIVGILAPGSYPTGFLETPNDNVLIYPPEVPWDGIDKYFDDAGVSFALASGVDLNLNDTLDVEAAVVGRWNIAELDRITVTMVDPGDLVDPGDPDLAPEPGTLMLLGTGMFGLALVVRRRFIV